MQHRVRGIKHFAEEVELPAKDFKGQAVRLVILGKEVDHGDITLLAVPVTAPDTQLDVLRVPRQIVVDDGLAELQVQPLV